MLDLAFLVGIALYTLLLGVVGGLAGLVLGNLRLPLLLTALPPATAGGTNIAVSGAGAGAGAFEHGRARRLDGAVFAVMAPPSIVGAVVGGYFADRVPGTWLILLVAAIVLEQGTELLVRAHRSATPAPGAVGPAPRTRVYWAGLGVSGLAIGILGGFVGLILGTIRLPAMLRAGMPADRAVGTNLAVGFVVGLAGLLGHLAAGTVDLVWVAVLAPPAAVGAIVGARLTGRLSLRRLRQAIGVVLVIVGAILIGFVVLGVPLGQG